jgi:hypothetical protein
MIQVLVELLCSASLMTFDRRLRRNFKAALKEALVSHVSPPKMNIS